MAANESMNDYNEHLPEFKGYDIEQLRYRRAYLLARCEIEKMRLTARSESMRSGVTKFSGSGLMSRLLHGLNYMDYAFLAYKIARKAIKVFGRRKR